MVGPPPDDEYRGDFASPPCYAHEVDPTYLGLTDVATAPDLAAWLDAQRARLRRQRAACAAPTRARIEAAIRAQLRVLLTARIGALKGAHLAFCPPTDGGPDLQALMAELQASGATLSIVSALSGGDDRALHRWRPRDGEGGLGPAGTCVTVDGAPAALIVPLLGWDDAGHGLGDGDTGNDAADRNARLTVGIGLQSARIAAGLAQAGCPVFDVIVTEAGVQVGHGKAP